MTKPGFGSRLKSVKWQWWALGAAAIALILTLALKPEKETHFAPAFSDPEVTPTMFTRDASSLVSDSGYVRYLIEAPVWYVFDEAAEPNWKFNRGLYLEKYDDSMRVVSTFVCDSAIYLSDKRLWEFVGNVRMKNETGDKFLTNLLYWDGNDHKIYSDSFIHIERSDHIIEGYGFTSDESIDEYEVHRPSMIIPVSDFRRSHPADTAAEPANPSAKPAAASPTASSAPIPAASHVAQPN